MSDTSGNGHDGPTDEEKQRIKDKVLEKFDEIQAEKRKKEEGK